MRYIILAILLSGCAVKKVEKPYSMKTIQDPYRIELLKR